MIDAKAEISISLTTGKALVSKIWLRLSVHVSVLVTIACLSGIFLRETYSRETEAWAAQAVGQDYVNLLVALLLLVCTYYLSKNSLRAYLLWLGAYIYLVYAFVIYAFFIHFNFLILIYIMVLGISFYALISGLMAANTACQSISFPLNTGSKYVSLLLMIVGILFSLLWLGEIIPNLISNSIPTSVLEVGLFVNPIHVLDLAFLMPAMIITSVLLWRKRVLGFLLAVPLMVFMVTMGTAIIAMFMISAERGMPIPLPAGLIIGLIIAACLYFSYLFLKDVKEIIPNKDG
jgi:hypothetical protein